jgi:hypothetical protein
MKRFRRWLFNGVAALSLLVFAATSVLYVRSYWRGDNLRWLKKNYQQLNNGTDQIPRSILGINARSEVGCFAVSRDFGLVGQGPMIDYVDPGPDGFSYWTNSPDPAWLIQPRPLPFSGPASWHHWKIGNLQYTSLSDANGQSYYFSVPWPYLALLAGLLPAASGIKLIRRRKAIREAQKKHCRVCGYDLRATPDRCPECGAIPPKEEIISN